MAFGDTGGRAGLEWVREVMISFGGMLGVRCAW